MADQPRQTVPAVPVSTMLTEIRGWSRRSFFFCCRSAYFLQPHPGKSQLVRDTSGAHQPCPALLLCSSSACQTWPKLESSASCSLSRITPAGSPLLCCRSNGRQSPQLPLPLLSSPPTPLRPPSLSVQRVCADVFLNGADLIN